LPQGPAFPPPLQPYIASNKLEMTDPAAPPRIPKWAMLVIATAPESPARILEYPELLDEARQCRTRFEAYLRDRI
jgi:hypothetical protein